MRMLGQLPGNDFENYRLGWDCFEKWWMIVEDEEGMCKGGGDGRGREKGEG